jgi:hypothetical protein
MGGAQLLWWPTHNTKGHRGTQHNRSLILFRE